MDLIFLIMICVLGITNFIKHSNMFTKTLRKEDIPFRLPKDIKPLKYDLFLNPNLKEETFEGTVSILVHVTQQQKYIMLHQKSLSINSVNVFTHNPNQGNKKEIDGHYPVDEKESYIIQMKDPLDIGEYKVEISFFGSLKDTIVGFYSSKYKDELNQTRVIATTKFEPTYARRAFPCFDEPSFKARFKISVAHPNDDYYFAMSNMNVEHVEVDKPFPGLTTVSFADSVPMSTYLVCFIVSDFIHLTKGATRLDGRPLPINVYTTKLQDKKGSFALDVAVKITEYYTTIFDIDYPLPKLDLAAIPDFVSGAMENWGLITFRESRLLFDEKTTSAMSKKDIITVVAHELAHMWFGNLVTMVWWNDLWLNEGFATFMQYQSSNALFPEWQMMDHFVIDELHTALSLDAKLNSHPIVQTVNNPDEITSIFDTISYKKGASVLRMLENFVTSNNFHRGVSTYLRKYLYENAETTDLFNMLEETSEENIPVRDIMETWTMQMGYPVIQVIREGSTFIVTQKRFLSNPESTFDPSESKFGYKWTIPITYTTSNKYTSLAWFPKDQDTLIIEINEDVDWVKFNSDQIGYYRVNYERSEWERFISILQWSHKRFTTKDRAHLLEDVFSLADAREIDYYLAMNMTLYLGNEKDFSPWSVGATKLKRVHDLLSSTAVDEKFKAYVRDLVDGIYHDISWNVDKDDSPNLLYLRTIVLSLACAVGHTECLEDVTSIFRSWINNEQDERPHPDIRSLVYYYGMNHVGREKEWDIMFKRFSHEKDAAEKNKLMNGLAGIRSTTTLEKFINIAMDEKYVRSQDALTCLVYISNNPDGTALVWDWVRENWQQVLVKRYTLNDRYLGSLIPAITKRFSSKTKVDEMTSFFVKYPEAGAGIRQRHQAIETVKANINWLHNNKDDIDAWLESKPKPHHRS